MLKLNPCIITGAFLNPELVVQKVFCNMPVSKENGKRLGGGGGGWWWRWGAGNMNQFTDADLIKVLYALGFCILIAQKLKCC